MNLFLLKCGYGALRYKDEAKGRDRPGIVINGGRREPSDRSELACILQDDVKEYNKGRVGFAVFLEWTHLCNNIDVRMPLYGLFIYRKFQIMSSSFDLYEHGDMLL